MIHPLEYFLEHFLEYWLFYFMFLSIIFKDPVIDLLFFPSEPLFVFLYSLGRFATEHWQDYRNCIRIQKHLHNND